MKTFSPRVNSTKVANIVNQAGQMVGLMAFELQQILLGLGSNPNSAVANVPAGPSPFVYQNNTDFPATAIVSSGTVSDISFSRDGVNFFSIASGSPANFTLNPADMLRVTYSVAPTINLIPR